MVDNILSRRTCTATCGTAEYTATSVACRLMTATNWLCVSIKTTDTFVNASRDTLALAKVQVAAKVSFTIISFGSIADVARFGRVYQWLAQLQQSRSVLEYARKLHLCVRQWIYRQRLWPRRLHRYVHYCYPTILTTALDIDECALNMHSCVGIAMCDNTVGSYSCICPQNYVSDGQNSCIRKSSTHLPPN